MLPEAFDRQVQAAGKEGVLLVAGREALLAERARALLSGDHVDEDRVVAGPAQLREAAELCETPSWFGKPRLVVAWGVQALAPNARATKEREEELAALERLIQHHAGEDRLLLWAPEADKRLRSMRLLAERGAVLDASPPERDYALWVRHLAKEEGVSLSSGAQRAYEESSLDLLALRSALRVGALASEEGAPVSSETARWAAPPGGELKVFALTDALLTRDEGGLALATPRLLRQGESPIGLVALAARQLRLLARALGLQAQGVPPAQWQERLGVHPFVARKIAQSCARWRAEDLRAAFAALLDCDLRLKSGGPQEVNALLGLLAAVRGAP